MSEFPREMKRGNFRSWIAQYGIVCLFHGRKLIKILPEAEAGVVQRILASNQEELERQLSESDVRVRKGEKVVVAFSATLRSSWCVSEALHARGISANDWTS